MTGKYDNGDSAFNKTKDALLMNEYLMMKFNSYADYIESENSLE